jgi:hypothetical protein
VKFADHAFSLEFTHGVERHQTIGVLPNELRIVAAVGDFVIFALEIVATFDLVRTPTRGRRTLDLVRVSFGTKPPSV